MIPLLENGLMNGPYGKLFLTSIIKEKNIKYDETLKMQEDLQFNFEYLKQIKSIYMEEKSFYHYIMWGSQSATGKYMKERQENYSKVEKTIFDFYKDKNIEPKVLEELYFICVKNSWSSIINTYSPKNNLNYTSRSKAIKNILEHTNFEYVKKANRSGLKYKLLKQILQTQNILLIRFFAKLMYLLKHKFSIVYN